MAREIYQRDSGRSRVMFALLESIDREGRQSQRAMAAGSGFALGLINTYLKICVKKGYVKVKRQPPRGCVYLLTPRGVMEKARLSIALLSSELEQFRRARSAYAEIFREAGNRGWRQVVLAGASELAEIAAICALESGIEIVALVDEKLEKERFIGLSVARSFSDVADTVDGVIITSMHDVQPLVAAAVELRGEQAVLFPVFSGLLSAPTPRGQCARRIDKISFPHREVAFPGSDAISAYGRQSA